MKVFVIARDKYSTLPKMVEYLLSDWSPSLEIDLIILDNGYPREILDRAFSICESIGFNRYQTFEFEKYANTNFMLDNIITNAVEHENFLLIENDCLFRSSQVKSLFESIVDTPYTYISPCILNPDNSVHFRPAESSIYYSKEVVRFSLNRGRESEASQESSTRNLEQMDIVERHCLLINPVLFRKIGKLDLMMNDRTDIDLSIQLKSCGGQSGVDYRLSAYFINEPDLTWDQDFLSDRWDIDKVAQAHARLLSKWNIKDYKNTINHAYEIRERFLGESHIKLDCYGAPI
ncbi:MAG: hypothetical protein AAF431_10480 [Pseudomonadota bacterium]